MQHQSLTAFLTTPPEALAKGPVALIFAEDDVEIESTLAHHLKAGFKLVVLLAGPGIATPAALADKVHSLPFDFSPDDAVPDAVNRIIAAAPGVWLYYCYNAEYLFFPFSDQRKVGEMLAFHTEERRDALLTYVVDLYADDLGRFPNAVSLANAHLDRSGYYALARPDPENHNHPKERQLDFFGGLRWRFEEHVPPERRKIDRIALFRARRGLRLLPNNTLNDEEYNTYSCPWHHNLTIAVCSFRTAKALITNPGSKFDIRTFMWHNSERFDWNAMQLMDLGLMEPGQWF